MARTVSQAGAPCQPTRQPAFSSASARPIWVGMPESAKPPAIRSAYEDHAELQEPIDAFVIGLGERIDALQDADRSGDLKEAGRLARTLAEEAEQLGYPAFAECAAAAAAHCEAADQEGARSELVELTALSHRVRRGHRSSA